MAKEQNELLVIAAGGGGVNGLLRLFRKLDPKVFTHLRGLALNTDGPQLNEFLLNTEDESVRRWLVPAEGESRPRCQVIQIGESGEGAGGDVTVAVEAVKPHMAQIEDVMRMHKVVVILVGLGGGTGSGLAPVIAKKAKELDILAFVVNTMPFAWEGNPRKERADAAKAELLQTIPTFPIYNQALHDKAIAENKNLSFDEAWDMALDSCEQLVGKFFYTLITQVGNRINSDLADCKSVARGGNYGVIAFYKLKPDDTPAQIGKGLFDDNPLQDCAILRKSKKSLMVFHSALNMSDTREVVTYFLDKLPPEKRKKLENHISIHEVDDPDDQWIGMIAVADEPPDEMFEELQIEHTMRAVAPAELPPTPLPEKGSVPIWACRSYGNSNREKVLVSSALAKDWERLHDYSTRISMSPTEAASIISRIERVAGFEPKVVQLTA